MKPPLPRFWKFVIVILGLALVIYAAAISNAQVVSDTVTWQAPTTRSDGTPLAPSEILQYRIAWARVAGGPYTEGSATVAGDVLTFTRTDRAPGRACYVGFTIDTAGLESVASAESCVEKCTLGTRINAAGDCVPLAAPRPPANVRAQ